ncbi:MAG: DNA translocase FtsK, partial [Planctomycetaceae bacterium]|nr:DNA translocase FtsK [Planctomycetaceae bacterium]
MSPVRSAELNRVPVILLTGIVAFLAVSLLSYSSADPPDSLIFPVTDGYENLCGKWGAYTASVLLNALGYSAYLLFVPLITLIYYLWHGKPVSQFFLRKVGFVWVLIAVSGLVCLYSDRLWGGPMIGPGGYLGVTCVYFLNIYFSPVGMTVIFVCTLIGGLVLACDYLIIRIFLWMFGLRPFPLPADDRTTVQRVKLPRLKTYRSVPAFRAVGNRNAEIDELGEEDEQFEPEDGEDTEIEDEDHEVHQGDEEEYEEGEEYEYAEEEDENEIEDDEIEDSVEIADESPTENIGEQPAKPSKSWISRLKVRRPQDEPPEYRQDSNKKPIFETEETEADENSEKEYALPLVELLIESEQHDYDQQIQSAKRMARQLEKAFADYGHTIKVVDIQCGPVIAQYELELERGLRLNKITNLTDDLAVALRVPTVRVVAPIPGKNTVGVEVPNEMRQLVRLREVIEETPEKLKSKMAIPIFLGKDVAGAPMVIDLAQMPHLLIAGRTGTGKSVCLNSIIVSILMTRTPDECRMIMIDPKMVELGQYESIPHLMHPVVTDMKKAEAILAWAVDKMEQRLQILSRARVRQLSEYNALSDEELYRRVKPETDEEWDDTPRSMPYMVIVADEMADLMLTAAKEVETHIIRLAAKSRAVGIHLVLATQKPTVDIITGLIKSNLPARIAFTVATRMDSQVILD